MENKDELKEIDMKNRTCCYFDDIMKAIDIYSGNILLGNQIYRNTLEIIYDISYKTFMGSKPLRVWFDKIDRFIKIHDGIRFLVLLCHSRHDLICDRINHLISEKSGITDRINHNFARIRIDSYRSLPIDKILIKYS